MREVVRLYDEERLSTRQIAAEVGVSYTTVHRVLQREQVERRPVGGVPGMQLSRERRQELLEAYRAGMPLHDMRVHFRVSDKTIKKLAEEEGLPARERGGPRRHDWGQIEQLHQQGWPSAAIAQLLHAGEGHVRHVLRELGYGRDVAELPDGDALKSLYAELRSVAAVAQRLGAARSRVREALVAAGVDVRVRTPAPRPGKPLPDGPTLLRLHGELGTLGAVASHLRVDRDRVRAGLVEAGWTPRRPSFPVQEGRPLPDVPTLTSMYRELGSVVAVATRLRASRDRVRDALTAAGVTFPARAQAS